MPGEGAVWPATVRYGFLIDSALRLRSIIPPTSKTTIRGPSASRAARRLPTWIACGGLPWCRPRTEGPSGAAPRAPPGWPLPSYSQSCSPLESVRVSTWDHDWEHDGENTPTLHLSEKPFMYPLNPLAIYVMEHAAEMAECRQRIEAIVQASGSPPVVTISDSDVPHVIESTGYEDPTWWSRQKQLDEGEDPILILNAIRFGGRGKERLEEIELSIKKTADQYPLGVLRSIVDWQGLGSPSQAILNVGRARPHAGVRAKELCLRMWPPCYTRFARAGGRREDPRLREPRAAAAELHRPQCPAEGLHEWDRGPSSLFQRHGRQDLRTPYREVLHIQLLIPLFCVLHCVHSHLSPVRHVVSREIHSAFGGRDHPGLATQYFQIHARIPNRRAMRVPDRQTNGIRSAILVFHAYWHTLDYAVTHALIREFNAGAVISLETKISHIRLLRALPLTPVFAV